MAANDNEISLREITRETLGDILRLKVTPDQVQKTAITEHIKETGEIPPPGVCGWRVTPTRREMFIK